LVGFATNEVLVIYFSLTFKLFVMQVQWRFLITAGILFTHLLQARYAVSQSLNDFQKAVSEANSDNGCESIPYPNIKDRCRGKRDGVKDYCKVEELSCDEFDPSGIQRKVGEMSGKIDQLKRDRDNLQSKLSSATDQDKNDIQNKINDLNKQIQDFQGKIEEFNTKRNDEKSKIRDRIEKGKTCLDLRIDVQKIFKEAKEQAAAETDPAIKALAEKLIQYWTSKEGGHQTAITNTNTAIDKCKSFQ
jgi:hypothetical protein